MQKINALREGNHKGGPYGFTVLLGRESVS